jgi:hypothetical protein
MGGVPCDEVEPGRNTQILQRAMVTKQPVQLRIATSKSNLLEEDLREHVVVNVVQRRRRPQHLASISPTLEPKGFKLHHRLGFEL